MKNTLNESSSIPEYHEHKVLSLTPDPVNPAKHFDSLVTLCNCFTDFDLDKVQRIINIEIWGYYLEKNIFKLDQT